MPSIDIKVIEGVFTPEEQRELVERVSEAVIAVEGEALRPFTHTGRHGDAERLLGDRWRGEGRSRCQGAARCRSRRVATAR